MIILAELRTIIENYNAHEAGPVAIDVALADSIFDILTIRPPARGVGVKILKPARPAPPALPPAPADRGNTAYVFMDSHDRRWILIKGNTQVNRGIAAQPGQIGAGSTKVVKKYGGILLEFNGDWNVTSQQNVVTFSTVTPAQIAGLPAAGAPYTKFTSVHRTVDIKPTDFLYTFRGIQFDDPTTHENRLILFAARAGRDFQDVRTAWVRTAFRPSLQHKIQSAVSYLTGIKNVLQRRSLWLVDLKPENTGYEEVAGEPILTPYDYLADGATFTIFKNQFQAMTPLLTALFYRPVLIPRRPPLFPLPFTDELFNSLIKQLIFEIANMMFLIFNRNFKYVREAAYNVNFRPPGSPLYVRWIDGGMEVCPNSVYLYIFFTSYCHNENHRALIPPPAHFSMFLRNLRLAITAMPGAVIPPPLSDDAWIEEFHNLVHNFRTSPAPVLNPIENLNMTI